MEGATITIDLDRLGFGGEDGVTLGEAVVVEAARQVLAKDGELVRSVRDRVSRIAEEEIRDAFAPLIESAMTAAIQPTNTFGDPKGEPTTLREVIVERFTRWLREPDPETRRSGPPHQTRVQSFIAKEVSVAVDRELRAALEEAREQVVAGVKDKAADVIAQTITRMVVR